MYKKIKTKLGRIQFNGNVTEINQTNKKNQGKKFFF